ncbi:hypothetical protein NQ658_06905 [Acinetobacter baumannii]|nr:hypothetical protein [Acinetobacter baumannii]
MTDLNKEREAFEAWVLQESPQMEWELNLKTDGEYDSAALSWGWAAWLEKAKAQVLPEGYVLLPRVPTEKMFQAYERYSVAPMSTLSKTGYRAMVEASESGANR